MAKREGEKSFFTLVSEAINDIAAHGFDSQKRLDNWLQRLAIAARQALIPEAVMERSLRSALFTVYTRLVQGAALARTHRGIDEYTLAAIKPKLRAELDRRILASANLIKLNREASIQRTLQRFAGWATSIPVGGSKAADKVEARKSVRKSLTRLPFEERRVIIDQSQKLVHAVNDIVAIDGGAIAGVWHSRWREAGYDYREDHKERDGKVYVFRRNWALRKGFMKLAGAEYTDQVTAPGEEPFCRCRMEYLYTLRDLPEEMLTAAGREALAATGRKIGVRRPVFAVPA